jgi:hypothetical protein
MSVSFFEITCDVPDCLMTIAHGPVRPPLVVGAFSEGVERLRMAHSWTVDKEGRDVCVLHSNSPTWKHESRIRSDRD